MNLPPRICTYTQRREFIAGHRAARLGQECPSSATDAFFVAYHFQQRFGFQQHASVERAA